MTYTGEGWPADALIKGVIKCGPSRLKIKGGIKHGLCAFVSITDAAKGIQGTDVK